ncbi:MAG: hypothetical protein ACK5D9_04055 [Burkholderiales bacterium]
MSHRESIFTVGKIILTGMAIGLCPNSWLPVYAAPPNTTAANSVPLEVGQGWTTHYFDEATQTRWFRFGEVGGRSYCLEAVQGPLSPVQLDPNINVYTDTTGANLLSANSVPQSNDNGGGNPNFIRGARTCYIAPTTFNTTTVRSLKLTVPVAANSGDAGYVRLRVVDTTLFLARASAGYSSDPSSAPHPMSAAIYFGNATAQSITASIYFGSRGAAFGVAANASLESYVGGPIDAGVGSAPLYVAHNGPPGALPAFVAMVRPVTSTGNGGTGPFTVTSFETIERELKPISTR